MTLSDVICNLDCNLRTAVKAVMSRLELTDKFCQGAKPKDNGDRADFFDAKVPGLTLRCHGSGKTWSFLFSVPGPDGKLDHSKRGRVTIGSYPATGLATARVRALELRATVEAGRDPREAAIAEAADATTVADLYGRWIQKHVAGLRSAHHVMQRMEKDALPALGAIKLSAVSRKEINTVLEAVAARAPSTAARLYDDLKAMFLFAVQRGDLQVNPMGSEGNGGLKRPRGGKPRERVLSDAEIRILWHRLAEVFAARPEAVAAIRLALVTAQRIGEVCGMTAGEIKDGVWTIPASRSKNKHAHAVPLSDLALSLVKEAEAAAAARGSSVFFNLKPARISDAINVANDSFQIGHWTCHDLRRTAATGMAKLGSPYVSHVLNHRSVTKRGVTSQHYVHYDFGAEKRAALDMWAKHVVKIIA